MISESIGPLLAWSPGANLFSRTTPAFFLVVLVMRTGLLGNRPLKHFGPGTEPYGQIIVCFLRANRCVAASPSWPMGMKVWLTDECLSWFNHGSQSWVTKELRSQLFLGAMLLIQKKPFFSTLCQIIYVDELARCPLIRSNQRLPSRSGTHSAADSCSAACQPRLSAETRLCTSSTLPGLKRCWTFFITGIRRQGCLEHIHVYFQ